MDTHLLRWARISVAALIITTCAVRAGATHKAIVGPKTTLDGLARKYDVPKVLIARANKIEPEALLRDGQVLIIPDSPPLVRAPHTMSISANVRSDRVALRRGPGTDYWRVTLLDHGSQVRVTAKKDNWYQVTCDGVANAWIREDFLSLERSATVSRVTSHGTSSGKREWNRTGTSRALASKRTAGGIACHPGPRVIRGDRVSVREGASTDRQRITLLDDGAQVRLLARSGDWCKVRLPSGRVGWVMARYVSTRSVSGVTPRPMPERRTVKSEKSTHRVASVERSRSRNQRVTASRRTQRTAASQPGASSGKSTVVRTAFAYRGTRYRYGGAARGGFDCSGFTSYVYRTKGVNLPHNAAAQFRCGKPVAKGSLKEGDLVFFNTTRRGISHVGIYIGGGKFVHASSAKGRVRVDTLTSGYYAERFRGGRRVK